VLLNLILAVVISCGIALPVMAVRVEEGKAKLLYTMLPNVIWPNESELKEFIIGFYGEDRRFSRALSNIAPSIDVRGRNVNVNDYTDLGMAKEAQVLIISKKYNDDLAKIRRELNKSGTLLVTDESDDKRHVIINFVGSS
jgi:hypothetical protein